MADPGKPRGERLDRSTETGEMRHEDDPSAQLAAERAAAEKEAPKHRRLIKSAKGGARLSAVMLPFSMIRSPAGYGVLTTIGRKTGKARRKCIRVIRKGTRHTSFSSGLLRSRGRTRPP